MMNQPEIYEWVKILKGNALSRKYCELCIQSTTKFGFDSGELCQTHHCSYAANIEVKEEPIMLKDSQNETYIIKNLFLAKDMQKAVAEFPKLILMCYKCFYKGTI